METKIQNIEYKVACLFEGVHITVEITDWRVSQPTREQYFNINISEDGKYLDCRSPIYAIIEDKFKKSELFQQVLEKIEKGYKVL